MYPWCNFICLTAGNFPPNSVHSHWLLRGHMTSNNRTVSRRTFLSRQHCKIYDASGQHYIITRECWLLAEMYFQKFVQGVFLCRLYKRSSLHDWSFRKLINFAFLTSQRFPRLHHGKHCFPRVLYVSIYQETKSRAYIINFLEFPQPHR